MLLSNDFVKAEHKYRMETMRNQHKPASGSFARTAGAIVVAALLTAALAACGVPPKSDAGVVSPGTVLVDAPSWQPNERLLRDLLRSYRPNTQAVVPDVEFGGMPAPCWEPNYGRLETYLGAQPTSGPR